MTPQIQQKAVMQYITPDEIAEELRVNVDVIYTWLRKGTLRGLKVGKYWRIRPVDYQSFLESQTNVPPENDSPHRDSKAPTHQKRRKKRKKKPPHLRKGPSSGNGRSPQQG